VSVARGGFGARHPRCAPLQRSSKQPSAAEDGGDDDDVEVLPSPTGLLLLPLLQFLREIPIDWKLIGTSKILVCIKNLSKSIKGIAKKRSAARREQRAGDDDDGDEDPFAHEIAGGLPVLDLRRN